MSKFKFFSDEDVDARLIKSLSDKGIDIKYAEKGIRNSKLYSLACKESRAILSRDKDFLNTLEIWRKELATNIAIRNLELTEDEIKDIKGFPTVTRRSMKNLQSGHRTEVSYSKTDYNIGIEDSLFTERFLRQPPKKWIE